MSLGWVGDRLVRKNCSMGLGKGYVIEFFGFSAFLVGKGSC